MTIGEFRVGTTPTGNSKVDRFNALTAELIDICESSKDETPLMNAGERTRILATAQTKLQEASMWFTKTAGTEFSTVNIVRKKKR